jgi:uncharacterized SAM-binding protein YcdF (DUF218 family)
MTFFHSLSDMRLISALRNLIKLFILLSAAVLPLVLQLLRGHTHVHRSPAASHQQEIQ